jgi:HAD superfamily hydrolase (TIGR01458 family)
MPKLLIDIDGVLYVGDRVVEGAADALARLQGAGTAHVLVTNTTSRPRAGIVDRLASYGISTEPERILTPPIAAVRWLCANAPGPVALFVPQATRADFEGLETLADDRENGAAAVVLGDLGAGWDFATYNRAFRLLMDDPRPALVALGATRYWRASDGLRLDVGAYVAGLEYAVGAEAVVLGKPAVTFFQAALDVLGAAPQDAVMIGDDIIGDVRGAQAAGLRAVLVRTGKFRPQDLARDDVVPDAVLESFADLPEWLASSR